MLRLSKDGSKPHLITRPKIAGPAHIIGSFLKNTELKAVLTTCHSTQTLFYTALTPILLQACVYGEYDKVNGILKQYPKLLHAKGTVTDYSGRTHKDRTVYQLALGACDFNVKDTHGNIVVNGMVEMIEEHFKTLPKSQAIMRAQYEGQFPPYHEVKEEERVKQDSEALHKITKMIENIKDDAFIKSTSELENKIHNIIRLEKSELANKLRPLVSSVIKAPSDKAFNDAFEVFKKFLLAQDRFIPIGTVFDFDLLKALYQFRNHLEPKEEQMFGKHFNYALLAEVAQLFEDKYARLWTRPKGLFLWSKVCGYIERFVPACDGQFIAQDPWSILVKGKKPQRNFKFTYQDGGGVYYPLVTDSVWELGYTHGRCCTSGYHWQHGGPGLGVFNIYIKQKYHCHDLYNKDTVSKKRSRSP